MVFDAAMLYLRFREFVLLHKILNPAEKLHAQHICFLPIFGAILRCIAHNGL